MEGLRVSRKAWEPWNEAKFLNANPSTIYRIDLMWSAVKAVRYLGESASSSGL